MRQSKPLAVAGSVRSNSLGARHAIIGFAVAIGLVWVGVAFAQEAYLGHKLDQQVADLAHQNAVLAAQNAGYKKDVQSLSSGAANEEVARLNGYAKPDEKTYLVTTPPSPSPRPSPTPRPSASPKSH